MDVFSAAATLAFAAKGASIWKGENDLQLMRSINEDTPNLEGLSENQKKFVSPLLEKNPSDRPTAIEAHQNALGYIEFLLGKTKQPRPLKTKRMVKRAVSSKKTIFAISAILAISVSGSLLNKFNSGIPETTPPISSLAKNVDASSSIPADTTTQLSPQIKTTSSSRDCETEYDNKGQDVLKKCLAPAKTGDLASMFYVGREYFANSNFKEAESWFLKGAKKNDLNSIRYLIETYTQLANTKERDRWTKICADSTYAQNDTAPLKDIAYCKMMQGFILTRAGATKEAILYLTDAADYGNSDAAAWLGIHYRDLEDKANALKWLKRAAELGSTTGINALIGYADQIGDKELTRKWLLISAESGNQLNMGVLALTYYYDKDFVAAKKWGARGVSFGDVLSTYVLGAATYDTGQREEGKSLLLKAANKGNTDAIRKLGSIYRLDEKNLEEAARWYEKLAARNDFSGTAFYSALLFMLGKDRESCTYNDKLLELGNRAKEKGTYDPALMDKDMERAKATAEGWCLKMYGNE